MSWIATTGGYTGNAVRDVMLAAVEHRFGNVDMASASIEWLSDNGSGYIAHETRAFASGIGLKPLTTPVCSPQSNGMAESFVKTMKCDYVAFMPKPDAATAVRNLAIAFEHYNEKHPHSALKYRSPREFKAQSGIINLGVMPCPEVRGQIQADISRRQIVVTLILPIPTPQRILRRISQLTNGGGDTSTELHVEFDRSHAVLV